MSPPLLHAVIDSADTFMIEVRIGLPCSPIVASLSVDRTHGWLLLLAAAAIVALRWLSRCSLRQAIEHKKQPLATGPTGAPEGVTQPVDDGVRMSEAARNALTGFQPLRTAGEWPQVEVASLEPAVAAAFEDLKRRGNVQPREEYDALRRLQSVGLDVGRAVTWLEKHREWWRCTNPPEKRYIAGRPGLQGRRNE